ncbi:MAG: AsmA-like C-terminal region-containing protein [Bacteroidota bacterium]
MKKLAKWLIGLTGTAFLLLLLLFIGLTVYVNGHKKELTAKAITAIRQNINGDVSIEDLNVTVFRHFPSLSIRLMNVRVTDALYKKHGHALLSAENLFVRLSTPSLLRGKLLINKLTIRRGGLYVFTDSSGYSNSHLLKKSAAPPPETEIDQATKHLLDWVVVEDFSLHLEDAIGDKWYDVSIKTLDAHVKQSGDLFDVKVKKDLHIGGIAFKKKNGNFLDKQRLRGEYALRFNAKETRLLLNDVPLVIGEQTFNFSGNFWLGAESKFDLHITSQQLIVNFAKSLLTPKIAKAISLADVKKPIDVDARLAGSLSGGDPRVHVHFTTKDNMIATKWLNMSNCSFNGEYLNEVVAGKGYTDENSHIYIKEMNGVWEGLPLNIKELKVTNLTRPLLALRVKSTFPLQELNSALESKTLQFERGEGEAELTYDGRTDSISSKNSSLRGFLHFRHGELLLVGPQARLKNCRGGFRFDNANLIVDSMHAVLANNPIFMKGQANNVLSLLSDDHVPVSLNWNIYAPIINLNSIQAVLKRKLETAPTMKSKKTKLAGTIDNIDHLLSSGKVSASLRADRLQLKRMDARNFAADIVMEGNTWAVTKASLQHGDGSVLVTANIQELSPNKMKFTSTLSLKNVDARKTFYAFENFGISELGYNNIQGKLNASGRYSVMTNGKGEPNLSTIGGSAFFSIKNGALINFSPLLSLQKAAFKNRNFAHVQFAEIRNNLRLENGGITIDRMAINSSVLSLFLEGFYGFNNNTDISIQVPLKNLKKREEEARPEFISGDTKGGMSVFLRATADKEGKIKIKYDPLARFRKK